LNQNLRNALKSVLFLSLGFALLFWAFSKVDMKEVFAALETANYTWVLAAFLCGVLSHFSRAVRWRLMLKPMGYDIHLSTSFYAVMWGYFMNYIIPRAGEISRCALVNQTDKVPFDKLVGTVLVERIVDMLMMAVISVSILIFQYEMLTDFLSGFMGNSDAESSSLPLILGILFVGGLTSFIVVLKNRKRLSRISIFEKGFKFMDGIWEGIRSIGKLQKPFQFIFHSLFIWFMYFMMALLIFYCLPGTSQLGINAGFTVLFVSTVAIIIPVPGGVGTFHTLVPAALLLYGISDVDANSYALISHSTQMIMILIVGGISFFLAGIVIRKNKLKDETGS